MSCKHAYNDESITDDSQETCIFCGNLRPLEKIEQIKIKRLQDKANKLSNEIEIAIGEDNMKNVNKLINLEIKLENYCNQ